MSEFTDVELFEGKNLSDLFKEIYDNSVTKKGQIKNLIEALYPLIQGIGDATLLVPLIKEYLEISVKNDEQLVKLAQIVQRLGSNQKQGTGMEDWWSSLSGTLEEDQKIQTQIEEVKKETEEVVEQ